MDHKSEDVIEHVLQVKDVHRGLEPLFSVHIPMVGTVLVQRHSTSHRSHTHHRKKNHQTWLNKISEGLFAAR